jgi:hypothetical protein
MKLKFFARKEFACGCGYGKDTVQPESLELLDDVKKRFYAMHFFALLSFVFSGYLFADWNAEIGLGVNKYNPDKDGTYYQEELPHDLDLQDVSYSIGAVYKTKRADFHIGLVKLGTHHIDSEAYPNDNEYSPITGCFVEECTETALFRGTGKGYGLYGSVSTPSTMKVYAEAGLLYHRLTWHLDVYGHPNGDLHDLMYTGGPQLGKLIGVGWNFTPDTRVKLTYYDYKNGPGEFPVAVTSSLALTLNIEF